MPKIKHKKSHPIVLVILDGWGVNQHYTGNAITRANTPVYNSLISEYPTTTLRASGEAVGLPWGEQGNSEVGHLNLGLGRILYQDLPRINKTINEKSFFHNKVLLKSIAHVRKYNSRLHLMGVVSNGCVHASVDHLYALLDFAGQNKIKEVYIHAILDGRDTSYNSGINFIKGIERSIENYHVGRIATISGRFYAMDRNNNWDRIERAYLAITEGVGNTSEDPVRAVEDSYNKKIYDEEFIPTVITENNKPVTKILNNDAVIFYNYRPDRARQITKAFAEDQFNKYKRPRTISNLLFTCFTEYEKALSVEVAFPQEELNNSLGEVLSNAGLKQLRIAETEKYAHVTYFFNGGRESKFKGEDHVLVPSLRIPNYDAKPEMSAPEILKNILKLIKDDIYDFILVNFANVDMVGHTGNIDAAIKAVEYLDGCVDKIVKNILAKSGIVLITADHGNAEVMFNMQTGQIDKEHTTNPVPFIAVGKDFAGQNLGWPEAASSDLSLVQPQGILSDVAPTVLELFNIEKPNEMTGFSLLPK